jgi:hypothetical protein
MLATFGDLTPKRLGKPKSAKGCQLAVFDPQLATFTCALLLKVSTWKLTT